MLLVTLGGNLLANLLTVQGVKVKIPDLGVVRAGEGAIAAIERPDTIRAG